MLFIFKRDAGSVPRVRVSTAAEGSLRKQRTSSLASLCGLLLLILILHLPFLIIHHVQEDAYITFRTARHLAEHGDLSFNLNEHYPGTTSLLYVWLVALIDLVFRSRLVVGVQVFGTLCVAIGSYFGVKGFVRGDDELHSAWLLLAIWPVSLVVSYTGMETPLLILALGFALYTLATGLRPYLFMCGVFTLPLIRPDAVAYGVILCAAMFLIDRRKAVRAVGSLCLGIAMLLAVNKWTSHVYLPGTIRAKLIAYHPDRTSAAVLHRVYDLFLHQSFLLPVSTTYLTRAAPSLLLLVTACFITVFKVHGDYRSRIALAAVAVMAVAIPIFYAIGGVIFDWYLYPANWLAMTVVVTAIAHIISSRSWHRLGWIAIGTLWTGLALVQWSRSLTASTQDYHYRADIGRYLHQLSHGRGRLFLEPAGYIPYFSGLATDDEVGLVSPCILHFMQKDPAAWWMAYVETEQPTYIVQREAFDHFETFEGYTLSPEEQRWFKEHYMLLRRTHYDPLQYHNSTVSAWVLRHGAMPDYLIYERIAPSVDPARSCP